MNDWMPTYNEPFFSTDRNPHISLPNGWTIIPDRNVSDIAHRTWRERLFTRPWRPLVRTKPEPKAYLVQDEFIMVSWTTFIKMKSDSGRISKET